MVRRGMVAARLDEAAATPTVTLRGLIAACRQESSGVSERRRLDERPRKVKYTRASPELAISATRPRRVRCVVYSVQCQVCRLGVSLVVFVAWCVSSQCSVSVSSHHRLPATHHRSSYRPVLPLALGLAGSHIYLWRFRLTMFFLLQPVFFFRLRDVRCFSSCGQSLSAGVARWSG